MIQDAIPEDEREGGARGASGGGWLRTIGALVQGIIQGLRVTSDLPSDRRYHEIWMRVKMQHGQAGGEEAMPPDPAVDVSGRVMVILHDSHRERR